MIVPRYFDIPAMRKKAESTRPIPDGWCPAFFGGIRGEHFYETLYISDLNKEHHSTPPAIGEMEFERHMLLTILQKIKSRKMVFVELGAGWGTQTLFVTMAVREQVTTMWPNDVWSLAVEAEPGHYGFLCETFRMNKIDGLPVFGAVSKTRDWAKLWAKKGSAEHYGQALHPKGNLNVPTFTLDYLIEAFKIKHVDLLHIDIQRAEPDAIWGSIMHIGYIDYLLVCPHYFERPEDSHMPIIQEMLAPTHKLCLSIAPRSGYCKVKGFPLPVHHPRDGIMVFKRRGIM